MTGRALLLLMLTALPARAEVLVAVRTIPAQSVIGPVDIQVSDLVVPGAMTDPDAVIGMEARVALYPGRPILPGDLALPATVERNAIVPLVYAAGNLHINHLSVTESRGSGGVLSLLFSVDGAESGVCCACS